MRRFAVLLLALAALAGCVARGGGDVAGPASPRGPVERAEKKAEARPAVDRTEQALGILYDVLFKMENTAYADPALEAYVGAVAARLTPHAGRPDLRFQVQVIDSPEGNAWSLPGGHLYVARGALALIESEAELAAVLSHEVAHTASRHSTFAYRKYAAWAEDEPGVPFPEAAHQRDLEFQADRLGLAYVRAAGYEPRGMPRILLALLHLGQSEGSDDASMIARITRATGASGGGAGGEVNRDAYLDHLDGLVYGDDPRPGILRGRTYLCPRCGLGFELPPGWTADQVRPRLTAREARSGATLEFRRADRLTPEALRAELAPSVVTEEKIAGFTVTMGTVPGKEPPEEVAVLDDGAETYRLTVKNPGASLRVLLRTLRPLTESEASLKPQRIHVRRSVEGGPFKDVMARCGGPGHPIETLALLNGVDPGDPIAPGRRIKCIGW